MSTVTPFKVSGWFENFSSGVPTFYLCVTDEGMVTSPADTPANAQFLPRIKLPAEFYMENLPQVWSWQDPTVQNASFAQLILDNYDGFFNSLLRSNARNSVLVFKLLTAAALLTGTSFLDAPTIMTCLIDDIGMPNTEDELVLTLKDMLTQFDTVLPVRVNPPFAADGAAGVMVPLTFGSLRNRQGQLVDEPNRIWLLHDDVIPNVTKVTDMAAPLDPYANPPQYVPARSGQGVQLQTMPVGKLSFDCSSYGTQSTIPGIADVLAGDGAFAGTWIGSPLVPPNWAWSNGAGSSITRTPNIYNSGKVGATLISAKVWGGSDYGEQLSYPGVLREGFSYRLNFSVVGIAAAPSLDLTMVGGLMVASALTRNPQDYISGYGKPIHSIGVYPIYPAQNMSYEFTVPPGNGLRDLIFIVTTSTGNTGGPNGIAQAAIYDITLEQLGRYNTLPQSGIPFDNYLTEILVNRNGSDPSVFNSSEAAAIFEREDGTLIPWGVAFDTPPNILRDCIYPPLATRGATTYTDNLGVMRFSKLVDPSNPVGRVVTAKFDQRCMARPVAVTIDNAEHLTTLIGSRQNQTPFNASDFVTDQNIVPQSLKTRFMRKSQFESTATVTLAGHYASSINAPIFDSLHDDQADAQDDTNRFAGIYSSQVYPDGTSTNGQRIFVQLTVFWEDPLVVGMETSCALTDLLFGKIVQFSYAAGDDTEWFEDTYAVIVGWKPYPFGGKIVLTVLV